MPTVSHSALTATDLHEPKGVSSASNNSVYVANGSGSGSWTARTETFTGVIEDVSTASTVYIAIPYAGAITSITTVLGGTIATSNDTITVANSGGTIGTVTVDYSGSTAGDVDSTTFSSGNTVAANSFVSVTTSGASTNTIPLYFTITLARS